MRDTLTERQLRTAIRMILQEDNAQSHAISKYGIGTSVRDAARIAQAEYQAYKMEAEKGEQEIAKKKALEAELEKRGLSLEKDRDKVIVRNLRKDPRYNFDSNVIRAYNSSTFTSEMLRAKGWAAYFDHTLADIKKRTRDEQPTGELPVGKKEFLSIDKIKEFEWYEWDHWADKTVEYNDKPTAIGDIPYPKKEGIGPGEERLAAILGAQVQGGAVSFDLVTKDGRRWECKELKSASDKIRPGTEGRTVMIRPQYRMTTLVFQMEKFVRAVTRTGLVKQLDASDKLAVDFVDSFLGNTDKLLGGEIAEITFLRLYGVLMTLAKLRKSWAESEDQPEEGSFPKTDVGLNDKVVPVDPSTFIKVSKIVQKAVPDENLMSVIAEKHILINILESDAFADPTKWLDEWSRLIKPEKIFRQTDGVFIINAKGFSLVRKHSYDEAFEFTSVSGGVPRFKYAFYDGVSKKSPEDKAA